MELLDGESLRERLAQGPLSVRKATDCAIQVTRGLAAAHDKGVVHRDLKPDNIFLLRDGRVKILDFGLARTVAATERPADGATGEATVFSARTDPGTVMGTVGYMAPEQVRGQAVDGRADLFALGTVLYEMLAGRRAFERDTAADTMTAILKEDPPEFDRARGGHPACARSHCPPLPREERRRAIPVGARCGVCARVALGQRACVRRRQRTADCSAKTTEHLGPGHRGRSDCRCSSRWSVRWPRDRAARHDTAAFLDEDV